MRQQNSFSLRILSILVFCAYLISIPRITVAEPNRDRTKIPVRQVADYIHAVIEAGRRTYSEKIVDHLSKKTSLHASGNWQQEDNLLLPAQFLLLSSQLSNNRGIGMRYRLMGLWPINPENGPKSETERVGLQTVIKNPSEPFTWVVHSEGKWYYQAIYPDFAVSESCVSCHNNHPKSPKNNFKNNDVMGGIIIDIPLVRKGRDGDNPKLALPPEIVSDYIHSVLESDRTIYSQLIVDRLKKKKALHATEYWQKEDGLMLPAQFLLNSAKLVSKINMDLSFRLISLWPINQKNGPANEFERIGLETLEVHPIRPYIGYNKVGRKLYFEALYPDLAVAESCISCHNSHPDSPKKDFVMDDLMGGVVITLPIK